MRTKIFKRRVWGIAALVFLLMAAVSFFVFWRYNKVEEAAVGLDIPKMVQADSEIEIPVKINTGGDTINAAEVYLKFDPAELGVVSVSKEGSFFQLWITDEPKFDNDRGEISFAGGLPGPGFSGVGQIGRIKIKVKKQGDIKIEFDKKSRALLNDGLGTEIKLKLESVKIKVRG